MDGQKQKVLMALVFFIVVQNTTMVVAILQKLVLCHDYAIMAMVFVTMVGESGGVSRKT